MNVFEAQKWAFSFADDHGMERSTIDMLICGQMDWDVTHLLMHYRDEFSEEDFEVFRQNVEKCAEGIPPQYVLSKAVFFKRTFLSMKARLFRGLRLKIWWNGFCMTILGRMLNF